MQESILLNLLECKLTLYGVLPDGSLGAALWSGQVAENLQVRERWITLETRPTGARYPVQHPLVPQYELSIERVWALPLSQLLGFQPTHTPYVLECVWTEEELGIWHRRTFYGVTIQQRTLNSVSIEAGHVDGQEFAAQYFLADYGATGTPAAPVVALPWRVLWQGDDGERPLYLYTEADGYVEAEDAEPETRAVIESDGSRIEFAGANDAVVETVASGVKVWTLHDELPKTRPQLRFYRGPVLLAAVTPTGLWARSIQDMALPATGFALCHEQQVVGRIAPGVTAALTWTVEE